MGTFRGGTARSCMSVDGIARVNALLAADTVMSSQVAGTPFARCRARPVRGTYLSGDACVTMQARVPSAQSPRAQGQECLINGAENAPACITLSLKLRDHGLSRRTAERSDSASISASHTRVTMIDAASEASRAVCDRPTGPRRMSGFHQTPLMLSPTQNCTVSS